MSKEEWFKIIINDGKDIVSELIKEEDRNGIIQMAFKKDDKFKDYLLERKENLLIEYLSGVGNNTVKEYPFLAKRLPSLLERKDNEKGILDSILDGSNNIFYKNKSFFDILNSLQSSILLTS